MKLEGNTQHHSVANKLHDSRGTLLIEQQDYIQAGCA